MRAKRVTLGWLRFADTYVVGTVDVEPEPFTSDDERWLELHVGVTLFEI
jgi:hypothetical protein